LIFALPQEFGFGTACWFTSYMVNISDYGFAMEIFSVVVGIFLMVFMYFYHNNHNQIKNDQEGRKMIVEFVKDRNDQWKKLSLGVTTLFCLERQMIDDEDDIIVIVIANKYIA
jgi:uncharacterized protein YdaU (DUF1376 family)